MKPMFDIMGLFKPTMTVLRLVNQTRGGVALWNFRRIFR